MSNKIDDALLRSLLATWRRFGAPSEEALLLAEALHEEREAARKKMAFETWHPFNSTSSAGWTYGPHVDATDAARAELNKMTAPCKHKVVGFPASGTELKCADCGVPMVFDEKANRYVAKPQETGLCKHGARYLGGDHKWYCMDCQKEAPQQGPAVYGINETVPAAPCLHERVQILGMGRVCMACSAVLPP